MKKYIAIFIAAAFICSLAGARIAAAATPSPVEKAIEGVKDKLNALVNAKDEQSPDELAFRVDTMKKVIEFSIAEANDLKVKLLTVEIGKEAKPWRDATVEKLNDALAHYADVKGNLEDVEQTIDLGGVKAMAQEFKEWRTAYLISTADVVRDFLLISQEGNAIETAKKRAQKIGEDVQKLKNAKYKVAKDLSPLLDKANGLVGEGVELNETARARFWEEFITPLSATSATGAASDTTAPVITDVQMSTSTATTATITWTTDEAASSIVQYGLTSSYGSSETTSTLATSHSINLTGLTSNTTYHFRVKSTDASGNTGTSPDNIFATLVDNSTEATSMAAAVPLPPSIRDLVKASLAKVREAYQVFIEMSVLVRKAPYPS